MRPGALLIIGGAERRDAESPILREFVRLVGDAPMVVATVATDYPEESWAEYRKVFREIGAKDVRHLAVAKRSEAKDPERYRVLDGARGIFFTGGDQLMITSQIGDTETYQTIDRLFRHGGVIAGTSAGASVMTETMLVSGGAEETYRVGELIRMAPGLGFLPDTIVDQHFSERGRITRLVASVAQNPRILGIGIDEDTAIQVEGNESFMVLGSGGVYVLDGREVMASNLREADTGDALSVHGMRLHLLAAGDRFHLASRRVMHDKAGDDLMRELQPVSSSSDGNGRSNGHSRNEDGATKKK